jgi:pyruvate formate lyase activating enzyme
MKRALDYEFRTTVVPLLHPPDEVERIGQELSGARRLVLQQFRPEVTLSPSLRTATAYTADEMEHLCSLVRPYVTECFFR